MSGAHRTLSAERKRRGLVADLALRRGGRRRGAHRGRRLWLLSGRRRRPDGQIYGTDDAMAGGLTGDEVLEGGAFDSWCASIGSRARPPPSDLLYRARPPSVLLVALTFAFRMIRVKSERRLPPTEGISKARCLYNPSRAEPAFLQGHQFLW